MAVAETTTAEGKSASGEARRVKRSSGMRAAAVLATSAVAGALSTPVQAQIVGAGPSAPVVIQTPNGLPQVNVNKPGGSGVSVNTYNQFDVQKAGAILNNSATMVQTQLGGWINGNPNFGPNDAARIIVNQVNSPNPSQIRGALETAGARAELVLANPSGIYLDGAGFINTSRATLTTGVPFYGADGSLAGYNVNRGLVTVAGAGLNASNLDQVDVISRAVQANAAIYAKNLNVIAGANQVNHDTLAATPIAGDGPAPAVAIDVAQLGGMYANRVFLVGNSAGVGVANAGTIAAQAGDLTLQSNGRLVLTGKTTASGNLALSAANGIQNSGTTYARQSLSASIGTDLTNSGTLVAQQDTSVNAGSVNSTGTLGAGVNNDGAVGQGGNLNLTVSGQLSATGQNAAGGNASLTGASVNLAGSQTTANGNLSLKRLGDGFYEQQLVRNQVTSLTGKAVLGPYADLQTMYESLMAAGADLSKSLDLPIGASLSADQVARLTSNVILMETRVVDGQSVLVPVVYLAQASQQNANGPLIAATNIDLQNAQSFTNSGTIKADNTLAIQGKQIDNAFGALQSGGLMALSTENNIDLTSANVKAGSLQLDAGKDLILDTATKTSTRVSRDGATSVVTTLGPTAKLDVVGDASITTGGNFQQNAGDLSVGGNLGMNVDGNWDLGAVQTGEHKIVQRANGVSNTDINKVTGSSVSVGGQSSIGVGGDLTARGAQIDLGQGGTLAAKGTVTLGTASATSTVNSNSSGSDSHGSYAETLHTSDQALTGTTLKGGDTVNIVSGKDITLSGSAISLDKGNANLLAAGDVNVGAATETHELNSHETHSHSNVVSGSKVASGVDQTAIYSQGSMISADGVTVTSGRDIDVTGSNIVGTNDVSLSAARDVNIKTSQDTIQSSTYFDKKETGLMSNGGLSVSVGSRSNSDKQQSSSVTNNGSAIGALNGNLTVSAGNDLHATGSILHAGNDVNLAGKTVKIDAATDTSNFAEQQQFRQAGVTVGVTNPVVAAVQSGRQMTNAAQSVGGDPRLIALAAATTGLAAKNTYDSLKQMGGDPVKAATSVGINVSVGASKNDSQMQAQSSTAVGSTVSAGRNVTIAAAGAGKDSNLDVIGSTISAGNNAKLAAEGNVNLQAAENTSSQHSTNSGASASVGVSFTVGDKSGVAFTAGVAGNRGNADGDSSTWTNTHVSAGNELAIQSGGDTNLKGAVASGKQVVADIGGNLNIESLQDKDHYDSKQQSAGISASVCAPPLCTGKSSVAGSIGQTKMNSDYASVIEQSGIKAGDGGFQVDVKGNTDLKGGVVASSDKAVQDNLNKLTTSTLTHRDIENHASYDASSVGLSGGYGGSIGKDQKGTATNVNPVPGTALPKGGGGLQVAPPVALSASGDANSTTKSGISGGAITIADGAKQQQLTGQTAAEAVSSVNRDTSNTGGALAPIFDKDKIQAGFDITSQLINQAGTFVANRAAEADAAKAAANNPNLTPEQRAAAQQRADELSANWGPNGTYHQVLTALSVAAGGNVTGGLGQFAQNATVAYLQELSTNQVKQIADNLGSEEARAALHAIVGCAGAAASSQSCSAGAMGAATSSVLGSLLAPSANLSASEREARDNLVASLVAGVATVSGQNVATATGAGKIEVENNQVSPMAPAPGWLAGFKLPGYKGEQSGKGDGVIADPATELDSTIKPTGSLIYPMPDAKTVGDWVTAIIPDQAKGLVDYITTAVKGGDTPVIDDGKQGKHQPDHNNFIPGRSELSYPDPQKLVDDYAGTGQPANNVAPGQPGYRERVNFGKVIGNYVDPVTGEKMPTTNGIVHYSKDGVHIVPGRPQ
ncbi:hemagglutinin repeat-containing protein [Burkholderia gladioli]|uniref:hemagglutinin repeat-containing protein n=1 Tax=Burkholderia gladioli TaxID=28095 RepID=UPI003C7E33CC